MKEIANFNCISMSTEEIFSCFQGFSSAKYEKCHSTPKAIIIFIIKMMNDKGMHLDPDLLHKPIKTHLQFIKSHQTASYPVHQKRSLARFQIQTWPAAYGIFSDKNLRELRVNVISRITICRNHEIRDWQFSLFIVILIEDLAKFCLISHKIAKITGFGRELDFTIQNTEVKCDSVKC